MLVKEQGLLLQHAAIIICFIRACSYNQHESGQCTFAGTNTIPHGAFHSRKGSGCQFGKHTHDCLSRSGEPSAFLLLLLRVHSKTSDARWRVILDIFASAAAAGLPYLKTSNTFNGLQGSIHYQSLLDVKSLLLLPDARSLHVTEFAAACYTCTAVCCINSSKRPVSCCKFWLPTWYHFSFYMSTPCKLDCSLARPPTQSVWYGQVFVLSAPEPGQSLVVGKFPEPGNPFVRDLIARLTSTTSSSSRAARSAPVLLSVEGKKNVYALRRSQLEPPCRTSSSPMRGILTMSCHGQNVICLLCLLACHHTHVSAAHF